MFLWSNMRENAASKEVMKKTSVFVKTSASILIFTVSASLMEGFLPDYFVLFRNKRGADLLT